jgi:FkbM family methyltransferase
MLADVVSRKTMEAHLRTILTGDIYFSWQVIETPQYFPKGVYSLPKDYTFVDCGAFDGDTAAELIQLHADYNKIICFEPSPSNFNALNKRINGNGLRNVLTYQKGCSDQNAVLRFAEDDNSMTSAVDDNGQTEIEVVKLDDYLESEHVDFIKMDIEGAEISALRGAEATIRRDKPICAISIYHKKEDLITIPQLLKSFVPEYKFFLRLHQVVWDLVLYAVPPKHDCTENRKLES